MKATLGSFLGTVVGLITGIGASLFVIDPMGLALGSLHANTPHQVALATIFILAGMGLGFVGGAIITFALAVGKSP